MTVADLVQPSLQKNADSSIRRSLRSLRRNPMAMLGLVIILFWAVAATIAPFTSMRDPLAQTIGDRLKPPSSQYWFGTDELGRDVFSRVIYGARISLPIGFVVIMFAVMMGLLVGASAGYIGGTYDLLIMRLADITLAFPSIVLALAIAAVLGPSITNALIAMVLVWWPEYARLMRSQVLSVKHNEYVMAAIALGASRNRILMIHILPNTFAPILVKASLDAGSAILNIAALSFIGLGAVPPTPEWGAMISTGRYQFYSWWLTTFPGLAILMVVLGYNFLGEGVRDSFDPRMT
ncbi:MAG: ABC transporter permease [Anaerolineales bacterium]